MRRVVPLSDQDCKKALPGKHYDGRGLFLFVTATAKSWRLKYSYEGREKLLTIGRYPQFGLSAARKAREEAKALLAKD